MSGEEQISEGAVDPLINATIGNYKVTRKIGEGGMGSVYLAERLAASPASTAEDFLSEEAAAVVYRPPFAGRRDARPDLTDADRFAEACLRALAHRAHRELRVVLLSSAAVHPPSHHNTGYLGEDEKLAASHPIACAWRGSMRPAVRLAMRSSSAMPSTMSSGSSTLPLDFDIFCPSASRTSPVM